MSKLAIMLLAASSVAAAQRIDLGALAGGGGFTASGPTLKAGYVGAETCMFCAGRLGLFAEYSHWQTAGSVNGYNPSDAVRRADLGGLGLRIHWKNRVRPFLDIGVVAGEDAHRDYGGGAFGGVVVGGGLRIPIGRAWYIRPQIRAYGLSPHTMEGAGPHWALGVLMGVGYSWR